jgi:acyl-CoA thioesterase II
MRVTSVKDQRPLVIREAVLMHDLLQLTSHGPDTYVGLGRAYPWGGLYGGHIVAQAFLATAQTVDAEFFPHSLRAYFIRRGDFTEPVRYEVDRTRNGRSFCTRRVVARQSGGVILNLESSFQKFEEAADVQTISMPENTPSPDGLPADSWSDLFDRRVVPSVQVTDPVRAWMKVSADLGDNPVMQAAALAYLSDDFPANAVERHHPDFEELPFGVEDGFTGASLDHTIWFHRPIRADQWNLHHLTCHNLSGARGLAIGHVFQQDGVHVATVAQEFMLRKLRKL